jgi:K+-dependent Na+/Ca+ exchanger-like protein
MFFALYIVCDEFFVPSLDFMSAKLGLSPDVAGATLMAAGGSAPEFFTSFLASLSPVPSSVGIAAIVGSAVFNVLFVIGACGIAAPSSTGLKLTWYPLARDSLFYIIDLAVMAVAFMDNKIEMWEAGLLFGLYLLYCFYMKVSAQVEEKLTGKKPGEDEPEDEASKQLKALDKDGDGLLTKAEVEGTELREAFTKIDEDGDGKLTLQELRRFKIKSTRNWDSPDEVPEDNRPLSLCIEDDGDPNVFHQLRVKSYWVLTLPIIFVLILTVPDCRRPGSERCYFLGFVGSIVWIAAFSYIMVHCTEMVGLATGVPKEILALTFVAWGTSIPDLVTSVLVTVQGHGDMAVSSSIGSNIFDVTVGLPIPWLIFMAINGGSFPVGSEGLFLNILMLVGMIFVTVVSIMANKWVLNRILGFMMLVLWSGFTIYSVVSAS